MISRDAIFLEVDTARCSGTNYIYGRGWYAHLPNGGFGYSTIE